jgi:hypothetical protein
MRRYYMLSDQELEEMLNHAFQEGWWTRQNKKDFSKDAYSTQARDNYVYTIIEYLTKGKK